MEVNIDHVIADTHLDAWPMSLTTFHTVENKRGKRYFSALYTQSFGAMPTAYRVSYLLPLFILLKFCLDDMIYIKFIYFVVFFLE